MIPFLIICPLTFLAGLVDSIAGGGGLISLPAFLLAGLPPHNALATNKLASSIGSTASTVRYCTHGYFDKLIVLPSIFCALLCVLTNKKETVQDSSFPTWKRIMIVCTCAFPIGMYDGFYGPGTGTFLLLALTRLAHMDVRTASGNVKLINLSSNAAALFTFLFNGQVLFAPGLAGAAFCLAGHYVGSGLVMKNGTKIVRPIIIVVLILLFIKVVSGH